MIRVAIVIEALGRGGAERLLVDTARRIDRTRFDLRVYTLFDARRDYADALRELDVPETCLRVAGLRGLMTGISRLRAQLANDPVDVIHTHLFAANTIGRCAAWLEGTPVVSSYHDADYEPVVRLGNPRLTVSKQSLLRLVDRFTARISNAHALAVSDYVAMSLRSRLGFPPERISTILNAVDTTVFCPDLLRRKETRRDLGIAAGEHVVLCVGRMTPQKGQDVLIRAMARPRHAQTRLVLAGDGPQRRALEQLSNELNLADRVVFLGTRSDVPDLLRAADVLALPSLHEGFGLVVAEALASGTAVVVSQTGPLPEIVRHGRTGLLVKTGDPEPLSEAIAELVSHPERRREMGAQGRADAVARFDAQSMIERLEALYESLAGTSASSVHATLSAQ